MRGAAKQGKLMGCPMYVDYTRECLQRIGYIPRDTFSYCQTEKFRDCPFYKTINKIGHHCEYIEKCPAYQYFNTGDFEKFVYITEKYCLSGNNVNCERFKLRRSGNEVPASLLPDGSTLGK